ncbi:hypothetical protein V2J09_009390 [Rumex salicifolius]
MIKTITSCNRKSSSLGGSNPIRLMLPPMQTEFRIKNHNGLNKSLGVMATSSSALVKSLYSPTEKKNKNMKEDRKMAEGIFYKASGKYGKFGGKFVPETLMTWLTQLEAEFNFALYDSKFQEELSTALRDYVGRETPLYHAKRLTNYYKDKNGGLGPEIYLKREDLCHGGAHKINSAIGQAMLAKRLGKTKIVAATGAGQHGVAVATACAKLALECDIFMGVSDMERQSSNVDLIKLLGAQVSDR